MTILRSLPSDDTLARDLVTAIKGGDTERLAAMLAADASLATCLVTELISDPGFPWEDLSLGLWNACRRGDVVIARLLIDRGADVMWPAPWSGETPLDIARTAGQEHSRARDRTRGPGHEQS